MIEYIGLLIDCGNRVGGVCFNCGVGGLLFLYIVCNRHIVCGDSGLVWLLKVKDIDVLHLRPQNLHQSMINRGSLALRPRKIILSLL